MKEIDQKEYDLLPPCMILIDHKTWKGAKFHSRGKNTAGVVLYTSSGDKWVVSGLPVSHVAIGLRMMTIGEVTHERSPGPLGDYVHELVLDRLEKVHEYHTSRAFRKTAFFKGYTAAIMQDDKCPYVEKRDHLGIVNGPLAKMWYLGQEVFKQHQNEQYTASLSNNHGR